MLSVVAASLWVLLGCVVAALPLRWQIWPGVMLLLTAPLLIVLLAQDHGGWVAGFGVFAVVSMFRRPLRHGLGRMRMAMLGESGK
ncbi:DUF2484 family protein [Phaeobacter sp.]|uniref:DUF2484 family protein n=1 Tax=Phaeobacter sp. TaxID=1902409 RepID=UPI0025F22BAE|nr:DUF2484 family protein [Phaeobacter sp.]